MENIFLRLYKHKPQPSITPEENFFTESFRFILGLEQKLCEKFVEFICNGNSFYPPFVLESQARHGNSIIDLEITDKNQNKILVEIKISAHENKYLFENENFGQVEKYLRLNAGYVCFISQKADGIGIKTNKEKYLGQFRWFQIYELIEEYLRDNKSASEVNLYFINNFIKFMEDLGMQPFKGFSKEDVRISQTTSFGLYDKIFAFLDCVKTDERIIELFKRNNLKFSSGTNINRDQFISLRFQLSSHKDFWAWFGFQYFDSENSDIENDEQGIYFLFLIWLRKEKINVIKENVGNFELNSKYFMREECLGNEYAIYNEVYFSEFMQDGLQGAINYIYESFLELEDKGVFKEIDRVLKK